MKVFTASINLTLRTTKTLSDGTHPIMLRAAWNGTKEVSTHFSCNLKDWDKKNQCLKKTFPNASAINGILHKLKAEAIERRTRFEASGEPYTAAMLLAPSNTEIAPLKRYKEVMEAYIKDRGLRYNTQRRYRSTYNRIKDFYGRDIDLAQITESDMRRFAESLSKQMKEGSIKSTLASVQAVCNYGVEKSVIKKNPFDKFNFGKSLKTSTKSGYIHYKTIEVMKHILMERIKDNPMLMLNRTSTDFPLWLFIACYTMQGLAPVDLAKIRRRDFEERNINGKNYYCVDLKRSKTGVPVKVRVPSNDFSDALLRPLMHIHRSHWLFPILDGIEEGDSDRISNRISYVMSEVNSKLKKVFGMVNMYIQKNKIDVPEIPPHMTFYCVRHSFSQSFLTKGGNPLALATLLGRDIDGISTYIEQLSEEADLTDAISIMV